MDNLTRRNIRYICFRLQNEVMGGAPATKTEEGIMQYVDEVKEHMEEQDGFGEWDKFAKTWDVDEQSPLVVVGRTSSIHSDWNKVLRKEAKKLSVAKEPKKFPEDKPKPKSKSKAKSKSKVNRKSKKIKIKIL